MINNIPDHILAELFRQPEYVRKQLALALIASTLTPRAIGQSIGVQTHHHPRDPQPKED